MNTVSYPRLIKRVRAVLIDSIVVPLVVVAVLVLASVFGVIEFWERLVLAIVTVLIMEPGLVALTGGTIGHHLIGIMVVRADGAEKLGYFSATVRAVLKFVLGWLSFIFVLTTTKHQAIHDLVANSVVVHKDISHLPSYEILSERSVESDQFIYPAKWRRALIAFLYWLAVSVVLVIVIALLTSDECSHLNRCTTVDMLASLTFELIWLLSTGALVVLGWAGRLPGARRGSKATA